MWIATAFVATRFGGGEGRLETVRGVVPHACPEIPCGQMCFVLSLLSCALVGVLIGALGVRVTEIVWSQTYVAVFWERWRRRLVWCFPSLATVLFAADGDETGVDLDVVRDRRRVGITEDVEWTAPSSFPSRSESVEEDVRNVIVHTF